MKKLNKIFLFLFIIFVVPIPSLFWLPRGEILAHGPIYPWPNASVLWEFANKYLFTWIDIAGFGNTNTEPSGFLYNAYTALAVAMGGSNYVGQVLFIYFGFVGCIGGMFILARTLGFTPIASLFAGVFYLLSPMVMSGMPIGITNLRLLPFYVATPVLFSLVVRALRPQSRKRELALFGIVSLFLGSAGYSGLQYFVLHLILFGSYMVFMIAMVWTDRDARYKVVRNSFMIFIIMFLANFYWLSQFLFSLPEAYAIRAEPGCTDVGLLGGLSVKLIDGFRMLPYPTQASISPWVAYYYTPIMTMITFGFVAIALFALVSSKTRRAAIFPGLLLVIILFLAKGTREPFSRVGETIFLSFKYVTRLFRNPTYFEMLVVFALALLIGLAIGEIIGIVSIKSWKHLIIMIVTVTILLIIYGWQFIIGGPINSQSEGSPSQTVKVPLYYTEITQFLRDNTQSFRILSIPTFTTKADSVAYRWQKLFVGMPPLNIWSGKPSFRSFAVRGKVNPLFNFALHPSENIISQNTWKVLLQIANVRYVTFHNDTDWKYLTNLGLKFNREEIYEFVKKSPYLRNVSNFGAIELYEFDSNLFLPHIYIPQDIIYIDKTIEDLPDILSSDNYPLRSVIYFNDQINNLDKDLPEISENPEIPEITFIKVNPTKYKIKVENAKEPYVLVFSESFNENWKLYINKTNIDKSDSQKAYGEEVASYFNGEIKEGTHRNTFLELATFETWRKKPIPEDRHFLVNGYANSWYIMPEDANGKENYEIIIEFWPQRLFYIGLTISAFTFLGCLCYLIYGLCMKKKRIKVKKVR